MIKKLIKFIFFVLIIFLAYILFSYFNFNEFSKSEYIRGNAKFNRDFSIKYSNMNSYYMENIDYDDAMFYRDIKVEPYTPYKVSCMVKTENIENIEGKTMGGAQIAIADSLERSDVITGTNDWTKLEFYFNSKNRETIQIAFRLGGNAELVKGKAWFSDFKIEKGQNDDDNTWNMVCYLFDTIEAQANGENVKFELTDEEKNVLSQDMRRFSDLCVEMSNNKININYQVKEITKPVTSISYDEENGYYVDPKDVYNIINEDVKNNEYDHIFVVVKLGDLNTNKTTKDWIGLGSMDYLGIGFSNIRVPSEDYSYNYEYNPSINTFPEEVFLHEFLHTLERNAEEYGYDYIALHDHEKYGYKRDRLDSLRLWYDDYMNKQIETEKGKIGLDSRAYKTKPVHDSNFEYSTQLDELSEPNNVIEEFIIVFNRIKDIISGKEVIN